VTFLRWVAANLGDKASNQLPGEVGPKEAWMNETSQQHSTQRSKALVVKIVLRTRVVLAIVVAAVYRAFRVSPWPSALLIRRGYS
jgi:hypothetical protein